MMNGHHSPSTSRDEDTTEQNPWPLVSRDQMAVHPQRPPPSAYSVYSSFPPPSGPSLRRRPSQPRYSSQTTHRVAETPSDSQLAQRYHSPSSSRESTGVVVSRNRTENEENPHSDAHTLAHITTGIRIGRLESQNRVIAEDLAHVSLQHQEALRENDKLNEQVAQLRQEQTKNTAEMQRLLKEISNLKSDEKQAIETVKNEEPDPAIDLKAEIKRLRSERNYYRDRCYAAEREFDQLSSPRMANKVHSRRTSSSVHNTPALATAALRDMSLRESGEGPWHRTHSRQQSEVKEDANAKERKGEKEW